MLHRSHPPASSADQRRRWREQKRRRRARENAHEMTCTVVIGEAVITMLIGLAWLSDQDSENREKVGKAISRMLRASADAAS
jgi:hypothetical protein